MAAGPVEKLYRSVIEDVINNVREAFLDEGVDEQILIELKQIWEKKLKETKAVEQREPEVMTHVVIQTATDNHSHTATGANAPAPAPPPMASSEMAFRYPNIPGIAHQLTIPSSNIMQQALLQYAAASSDGSHDGQKTVTLTMPQKLTITLPAQLAQGGLQTVMSAPAAAATLALPPEMTASLLQQAAMNQGGVLTQAHTLQANHGDGMQYQTLTMSHQAATQQRTLFPTAQPNNIIQLDGAQDSSEEEEDEDFADNEDDRDNDDDDQNDEDQEESGEDDDPLNSEDDVSDNDPTELFDTENVVVCQYDKVTRSRNRWKLHLKDGIMNLQGKDFVFQKAVGDAEW